jgi:hypothetical protein
MALCHRILRRRSIERSQPEEGPFVNENLRFLTRDFLQRQQPKLGNGDKLDLGAKRMDVGRTSTSLCMCEDWAWPESSSSPICIEFRG